MLLLMVDESTVIFLVESIFIFIESILDEICPVVDDVDVVAAVFILLLLLLFNDIVFRLSFDDEDFIAVVCVVEFTPGNIISVSLTDDCSTTTHVFDLSSYTLDVNVVVVSATLFPSVPLMVFDDWAFLENAAFVSLLLVLDDAIEEEENSSYVADDDTLEP